MSTSPLPAASTLATLIDSHPLMHEELPLVHTMLCEQFSNTTSTHHLTRQMCDVFREPLVYLFYGRPAYRSLRGRKPTTKYALCPVCLVFKPHTIGHMVHRMYPFDSGALHGGMFEPLIPRSHLPKFNLSTVIESARRYVHMFFETNREYYGAVARPTLTHVPAQPEAKALHTLITLEGEAEYDDRRSVVEVQICKDVPLKDMLLTVILPTSFLELPVIRETLVKVWRTYPLSYSATRGATPIEYYGVVRELLESFLRKGGYL
jgi:hypothetical protein